MKTGKVTAASYSGRTWSLKNNPSKLFYVHNISIDVDENGQIREYTGEYSSVAQTQTNFVIGQEASFDYFEPTKQGTLGKIKPVKADQQQYRGQQGAATPSNIYSPEKSAQIAKQVSYEAGIATLLCLDDTKRKALKQGSDYTIADKYAEWMSKVTTDTNTSMMASNALRRAIECLAFDSFCDMTKTSVSDRVIAKATEIFNYYISKKEETV